MEKRKTKGFLAMLLALAMIITLLPAQAFATDISVAEIGSTKYETLAAAVSAAQAGDKIKLIGDETITSTLTIGKDLTLDLNGHTLTMTVTSGMSGAVYVNSHSLTIQDSSDGQAGRIDITSNSGNGAYGFYLSGSGSSLSIESGSITATNYYNSNGSYFSQKGIDAVCVSSGTSFTMSGGSLTASNANNSGKAAYAVYVSGGTANITGGSIIVDDHDTYGWSDDHLVYKSSGTVNITGGKFKSPKQLDFNGITSKLTGGYMLAAADDDGYRAVISAVAQIGNAKYTTLAEAIAAVPTDGTETTITMIANEVLSSGVTIVAGQNIVLELNGKIVSESLSQSGTTALITNRGTLTIQDNTDTDKDGTGTGKITYFNGLPDPAAIPGYASNTIANNGTLTIESGLVENTTNGGYAAYTVDNLTNGNGYTPVFTMNGGRLYNNYTDAVRMFLNSDTKLNKVVINGGVLDSDKASGRVIVIHNPNSKVNKGELDITGGTINGKVNGWSAANAGGVEDRFSDAQYAEIAINISGGNIGALSFAEMANETLRAQALQVTGGKYKTTPSTYVTEGYEAVAIDEDPYFFEVVPAVTYVAQIGEEKYEKLSDAILALKDGDTLTLLEDYDFVANEGHEYYWIDDGGNKPYNKNNQLEIAANNITFDLNGHEITNLMNNSICIGANASGTTYQNITIKDGSLKVGIDDYARKDNKLYAYVVSVRHAEGVKFENLTTLGGINVTDGSVVEIDGLTFEGTKFYAVCSQEGADITLRNGDFSKYEVGSANTLFWVETGSTMSIYGGTYSLSGTTKFENDADPVLYGGIYNFDPAAYVANGYKAVAIGEGLYQVGVIEATATQEGDVYDNEVTFSVGSVVKDADEEVITGSAEVAQSITLTGTFENDYKEIVTDNASKTAVGAANLAQFDEAQLPDIVAAAYVEAGNQAADIKDVKIVVVSDGVTEGTSTGGLHTLTYEVHPEAITYNAGGEAINSVAIANSQLGSEAVFSIKLPVSDELYSEAVDTDGYRYVSVTHVSSDEGYEDEVGYFRINGTAGSYYIICDVTHFSEFELEPVVVANVAGVKVQASITLQDDIKINFYVNGLDGDKYVGDYKVRYTYNGVTTEVRLDEVSTEANGYKFVVAECAARQMNDTVDFRVFYQDTEIFRTPDYSIRVYCEKQLAKSNINAKLRNICLAVLDYGAAAQNYFGYQKSNLANATYTAGTVASTVVPVYVAEATWDGAVSKVTASLSLKSRTELNFYIYSASYIDEEVTVTVGGSTWTNYTYEYLGDNDGLKIYKLTVKGIASGLLGQNVSFEILEGGIASATYSPMSYAYRNQNKGAGLGNVCKALYNYYVAASAYFN